MIGSKTLRNGAVLAMLLFTASCSSTPPGDSGEGDGSATSPTEVDRPERIGARRFGPIEVRAYDGLHAADRRIVDGLEEMATLVTLGLNAAEEGAGVAFVEGRGAALILVDRDAAPNGDVTTRLLDGVRRPVIRVPAGRLATGEFVPAAHFVPLVVEAAVLAAAGERVAPPWLRSGLAVELGGAFDRVLYERALAGPSVRVQPSALIPLAPGSEDALAAAVRVRALARIARGDRALARFVVTRLTGASESDALAEVGVHDVEFLEAAAETERDRALARVTEDPTMATLAQARAALEAGSPSRGIPSAGLLDKQLADGDPPPFVATDARLVVAAYRLEAGDAAAARVLLQSVMADPTVAVRWREARLLEARAAEGVGETREALKLFRAYATDYPGAEGSDEALRAVGVDPGLAARVPGLLDLLASDVAADRRIAAQRLGETGDPAAEQPLRQLAGDDDPDVRRVALTGMALVMGDRAAPELELATHDPSAEVRGAALGMLAFADEERGLARARQLESDEAPEVRSVVDRLLKPSREDEKIEEAAREAERLAAEEDLRRARDEAERAQPEKSSGTRADPKRDAGTDPLPPPKPPRPLPPPKKDEAPPNGAGGEARGG